MSVSVPGRVPAETGQLAVVAALAQQLCSDDLLDAHERAAVYCGYTLPLAPFRGRALRCADLRSWTTAVQRGLSRQEAQGLIVEMKRLLAGVAYDELMLRHGIPVDGVQDQAWAGEG